MISLIFVLIFSEDIQTVKLQIVFHNRLTLCSTAIDFIDLQILSKNLCFPKYIYVLSHVIDYFI